MGRRTWIKIYTDKWLRGSLRKEGPETRSLFVDLLALAGDSAYGDNGIIQLADKVGFTDETIAGMLNVPLKTWTHAREILSNHNIPAENRIKILPLDHGFAIEIINWNKYQSEYQRQKPTRTQEKEGKVTPIVTDEVTGIVRGDIEGDRDIDIDEERKENKNKELSTETDIMSKKEDIDSKKTLKFKKPSPTEIRAYCQERKNKVDPEKFFNYYESNGWRVGRNPMKDWMAAVRNWEKNPDNKTQAAPYLNKPVEKITNIDKAKKLLKQERTTSAMIRCLQDLPPEVTAELIEWIESDASDVNYLLPILQRAKELFGGKK